MYFLETLVSWVAKEMYVIGSVFFFFLIWNLFEIYQLFNIEKNAISICSTDIRKYSSYF